MCSTSIFPNGVTVDVINETLHSFSLLTVITEFNTLITRVLGIYFGFFAGFFAFIVLGIELSSVTVASVRASSYLAAAYPAASSCLVASCLVVTSAAAERHHAGHLSLLLE